MSKSMSYIAAGAVLASAATSLPSAGIAQEFKSRTLTIVVGFPPGGGYDANARFLARHWGKHLPGNPSVVIQNQPGAGSLNAANMIYNIGAKDGSQVALFSSSAAVEPLLKNKKAMFDLAKMVWVGNMNRDTASCAAWETTGVKTWADIAKRPTKFGASGPAAVTAQHPLFLKNVLGAPFHVIMGYGGTGPVKLAMQRGEVEASCGIYISTAKGAMRSEFDSGKMKSFIQFGKKNHPFYKDATNIYTLIKTPEDKALTAFIFDQTELTRPVAAPPGLPPKVLATLRESFMATMKDPEYIADLAKVGLDSDPMTGKETAEVFAQLAQTPAAILERAAKVIAPAR
ncbi:MAG: Bug family tripartite tricarboxylate transporter substrate binding protein [Hyphomicrobiaceae bacterium]